MAEGREERPLEHSVESLVSLSGANCDIGIKESINQSDRRSVAAARSCTRIRKFHSTHRSATATGRLTARAALAELG